MFADAVHEVLIVDKHGLCVQLASWSTRELNDEYSARGLELCYFWINVIHTLIKSRMSNRFYTGISLFRCLSVVYLLPILIGI